LAISDWRLVKNGSEIANCWSGYQPRQGNGNEWRQEKRQRMANCWSGYQPRQGNGNEWRQEKRQRNGELLERLSAATEISHDRENGSE
jgi:hypothetical protein